MARDFLRDSVQDSVQARTIHPMPPQEIACPNPCLRHGLAAPKFRRRSAPKCPRSLAHREKVPDMLTCSLCLGEGRETRALAAPNALEAEAARSPSRGFAWTD